MALGYCLLPWDKENRLRESGSIRTLEIVGSFLWKAVGTGWNPSAGSRGSLDIPPLGSFNFFARKPRTEAYDLRSQGESASTWSFRFLCLAQAQGVWITINNEL